MRIHRILTVLALVALMCAPARAKDNQLRNEIAISYGAQPNSFWVDAMTDIIPALFGQRTDNKKFVGPLGLEYFYHTSPLLGVGGIFTANFSTEDIYSKDKLTSYRAKSFYSLMPAAKFNWLRKAHFGMYSGLSAGVLILSQKVDKKNVEKAGSDSQTDAKFIFNVTGIGMEFGGEAFRGFGELGMGEKGILCLGVRYKF